MNYITQIILVTLLVITAVLSTSLAATGEITKTEATTATIIGNTQRRQQNVNLNRQHHKQHHHHHHYHNHHTQHNHNQHQQQQKQQQKQQQHQQQNEKQNATHLDKNFKFINEATRQQYQQQQQQQQQQQLKPNVTRLRRMGAREYFNKVTQRRLHTKNGAIGRTNDWSYNNYNVHTNTFGGPSYNSGKGDDNTQDVEFIGASSNNNNNNNNNNDWGITPRGGFMPGTSSPPRRYDPVTAAPPPLVPARRGYDFATQATPSSESPVTEGNSIDRNPPSDSSDMERRHICMQQRTVQMPVKTTEVYTRPIWKHISTPCQPQIHDNQMCTRVQLVHEPAYRDVIRHTAAQQRTYDCCAGWMREVPLADGCMKPICTTRCQNGGSCMSPEMCSCPAGFTGRYCEHDVNECKEDKPCDHNCINTVGSYYCRCRDGFVLQADQQSCKKFDLHDDDAFEARDMENEIESHDNMAARLQKIERSLANERVQTNELEKSLQSTYHVVDSLKNRLNTLEKQQQDLHRLQTNLYATESRTNKLEGMLNLLMKCRNGPNAYCP